MSYRHMKFAVCLAALPALASAAEQQIVRAGEQASLAGPEQYFTGRARIDPVWPATEQINASGGLVTFEPGTRSAWHTHPAGQWLVVTLASGASSRRGSRSR